MDSVRGNPHVRESSVSRQDRTMETPAHRFDGVGQGAGIREVSVGTKEPARPGRMAQ